MKKENIIKKASEIVPSQRQLDYQNLELSAMIYLGMGSYSNLGDATGTETPRRFNPSMFDSDQWCRELSEAGFKGVILPAKYHDGFCLWPSKYTDHTVAHSDWREGKGDVVLEVKKSCDKYNLKFGLLYSLFDKHEEQFGKEKDYTKYVKNQLTELLTNYGEIYYISLDDAIFEQDKALYDIKGFTELIRKLQPDCVIGGCGSDVRWGGNDRAQSRESEWSVIPEDIKSPILTDLGSISKLKKATNIIWRPAEFDLNLWPYKFYYERAQLQIAPLHKVIDAYINTVGNNSSLIVGVAPNLQGTFSELQSKILANFKSGLDLLFKNKQLPVSVNASNQDKNHTANSILKSEYWKSEVNAKKSELVFDFKNEQEIKYIELAENIQTGQQIEKFTIYGLENGKFKKIYSGNTVGRKKICEINKEITTSKIKLVIEDTREFATISNLCIY